MTLTLQSAGGGAAFLPSNTAARTSPPTRMRRKWTPLYTERGELHVCRSLEERTQVQRGVPRRARRCTAWKDRVRGRGQGQFGCGTAPQGDREPPREPEERSGLGAEGPSPLVLTSARRTAASRPSCAPLWQPGLLPGSAEDEGLRSPPATPSQLPPEVACSPSSSWLCRWGVC